jgi:hypothetical protein
MHIAAQYKMRFYENEFPAEGELVMVDYLCYSGTIIKIGRKRMFCSIVVIQLENRNDAH